MANPITLVMALKDHCSPQGESLTDFRNEYKRLTEEDKVWFRAAFAAQGIELIPAVG